MQLKRILRWLNGDFGPEHDWVVREADLTRTCAICNRVEQYDHGGGFDGPSWDMIVPGDKAAHKPVKS
jgi:hypothetical protein